MPPQLEMPPLVLDAAICDATTRVPPLAMPQIGQVPRPVALTLAVALYTAARRALHTFARVHCHSRHRCTCLLPRSLARDTVGVVAVHLS